MKTSYFIKTKTMPSIIVGLIFGITISSSEGASIVSLYGDVDGFGFSSTVGLVNFLGAPADVNGNGILEPGEFIPDLDNSGQTSAINNDFFDNRNSDPLNTDVGIAPDAPTNLEFIYSIPAGHQVISAELNIIAADVSPSLADRIISIDGISTGIALTPMSPSTDGFITQTTISIDSSLFLSLTDGHALASIFFSPQLIDDIAIDYASLTLETASVPVPATAWLFGSGVLGLVGVARRKKA